MKLFGYGLFGQAITVALVGAALMLPLAAGHAQSGAPFAGFAGAWSGTGTVSLSDGSTERIHCKADYKVNSTGMGLKQQLHCASDSYKFDLSSDVTSNGERISGNWSEASRNASGSISGRAAGDRIEASATGPTFSAALSLTTRGRRQTVSIRPEGTNIRAVSLALDRR